MPSLKSHSDQRTVFGSSKGCSTTLFFSILGVIAVAGFVIHYVPVLNQMPWAPIKFGCWGLTGFFLLVIFISRGIHASPSAFIFDHVNAVVRVQAEGGVESYIPYQQIKKLDVFAQKRTSDGSTTIYYYGYLEKRDGSQWHFVDAANEQYVRTAIDLLQPKIATDNAFVPNEKSRVSNKIKKDENTTTSLLHWTNHAGFRSVQLAVYSMLYIGVFGFCLYVIFDFSGRFPSGAKIACFFATAIFGTLLGFLLVQVIRRNLKNLFLRFALSVSESTVEYFEFKKGSGERKASVSVTVEDIVAIRYGFQSWENYKKPLEIVSRQDPETPVELYMDSLTPVEILQVESWLQEALEAKTGKSFANM
jgi:hypothetical protein